MNTNIFKHITFISWALSLFCSAQSDPEFSTKVKIDVLDEVKSPIEGADVLISYAHLVDGKLDKSYRGKTDAKGGFEARDKVNGSVVARISKENYYPIFVEDVITRAEINNKKTESVDLPLIMRRVKSPCPLYAKMVNTSIPEQDRLVGFDFELGDWVMPFGLGLTNDLFISYSKKFIGYKFDENELDELRDFSKKSAAANHEEWTEDTFRHDAGKWIGVMKMNFQNAKEGIALVDKDYFLYSWLRMPHKAYETGYMPTWQREENTFSPRSTKAGVGYFLRVRVKLDDKGEVRSANYVKFTSDIQFDPRGRVQFTYFFNPIVNDRNLEFNPHNNLFKSLRDEEQVMFP